ncbi:hypothetical protein Tco_1501241 [Tanacetum coccineum]
MAASAIAISSDSSDESVGSPPSRVILFGDIPTVIPSTSVVAPETSTIAPVISSVAPVVETTLVASPTGLCGLVPYSDSNSDSPDEMSSPEHISPLPAISPFLCTDSSKAPDSSDGPPSQDPYVMAVAHWRSKVASRPSSSSSEFPIAPVTALPGIRELLTARKRVGPLPACRLAWRRASPHQAHSGSSTRDVPPRLCYLPRRAPQRSEAFHRWCAALLSTLYPPTTSESSSGDSSEDHCIYSSQSLPGPTRKRFKKIPEINSFLASIDEVSEVDPIETEVDTELGNGDGYDVKDHVEIDPRDVRDDIEEYEADTSAEDIVEEEIVEPAGEDSFDSSVIRDGIVRSFKDMPIDLDDARRLEADQLIAKGERAGMIKRIESLRLENIKVHAMLDIERDHVNNLRLHMSLSQEEFCQVRRDRDDTRGRLRRLESYVERHLGFRP